MSWYGITLHGQSTYGLPTRSLPTDPLPGPGLPAASADILPVSELDVQPFVALPTGYDKIVVTWKAPSGSAWDEVRLLRNKSGYPSGVTDGTVLLDTTGSTAIVVDRDVTPGAWHYYTLFVHVSGVWFPAANAITLMTKNNGYGDTLLSLVPEYYRLTSDPGDDIPSVPNEELENFLQILGLGFDDIKTYYDALLGMNDPDGNSLDHLRLMANQFGLNYNAVVPARMFRERVRNAGLIASSKGTLQGIVSAVSLATGWGVTISGGPNMLLNDDRSRLLHPSYPTWDPAFNYAATERVIYQGYLYEANVGGAYGQAQAPTGVATNNTWWTNRSGYQVATNVDADGYVAGYEPVNYTTGVTVASATQVALGLQSPLDTTNSSSNVWAISNATGATADLGLRAISRAAGSATVDPERSIFMGDPLPRPAPVWDPAVTYNIGDIVYYDNQHYRSTASNLGNSPAGAQGDNGFWICLGLDERFLLTGSVYVNGVNTSYPTYMLIDFYDEHGKLICTIDDSISQTNLKYDSFTARSGDVNTRTMDVGSGAWTSGVGAWKATNLFGGVLMPVLAGIANAAKVTSVSDTQIGATFFNPTSAGSQSVLFRYSDNSNYWYASRTALVKVVAGTATSINHSTAFGDGDRITVQLAGSSIIVLRNGTQVNTATDSFNSTATTHGLVVI